MAERRTITFDFDNDNRPIRDEKVEGKLFELQYKQALLQIESYLRELDLEKIEETQGHSDGKVYTEHIGKDIDYTLLGRKAYAKLDSSEQETDEPGALEGRKS